MVDVGMEPAIKVSYILLTYNQEFYIEASVRSALAQTYRPLEVLISDDASTDATPFVIERILAEVTDATIEIKFFRNAVNQGVIPHLNSVLAKSSGDVFVLAAGDDVSTPCRTENLLKFFLSNDRPLLIHSKAQAMDESGLLLGYEEPPTSLRRVMTAREAATAKNIYLGATAMWTRELSQIFGPITEPNAFEDLVMGFRAALVGRLQYLDQCLVHYRVGVGISQGRPTDYADFLRRRRRGLEVIVATLRQRLKDVSNPKYHDPNLILLIKKQLFSELVRLSLYDPEIVLAMSNFRDRVVGLYFRCSEKLKRLEAFLKSRRSDLRK